MSAVNEIAHIHDEDLLKKMWHETEDFGRKKEIRAHMYKLREERLKDLYSTSGVDDLHVITNKKTSFNQSMHTDALGDHSFASLKRKEIRDSESPTKEVSYRTKGSSSNEGWNISKIEEHSEDGKSYRFAQSANRSGTDYIPQGKIDFQAKNSQELTSFQDGDDKNFVKSHGTTSNSHLTQEAVGGDGNSSFRSSSTKSSSSSRTVTEQKSSYGDVIDYPKHQLVLEGVTDIKHQNLTSSDTSKIASHKNTSQRDAVDQQQKQITLEIVAGYNQNDARSSSNTTSSRTVTDQKSYDNYTKQLNVSDDMVVNKTTKVYTTDAPKELKSHPGYVEGRTKITRETRTLADGTVVTTTKYETGGADELKSTSSKQYISSSSSFQDNKSNTISSKSHDEKISSQRVIDDHNKIPKNKPASRYYVEKTHTIPSAPEDVQYSVQSRRDSAISEKRTDTTKNEQSHVDRRYETTTQEDVAHNRIEKKNTENVTKKTVHHIELDNDTKTQKDVNIKKEIVDKSRVHQKTIATHDVNSVPLGTPIEIEINLTRLNDNQQREYPKSSPTSREVPKSEPPTYDSPRKREPIKHDSEMTTITKATDGQYDTTYRTDYTNKKISIEVSPTHDAFARSLRAVSPDRLNTRNSSKNLKSSNTSLRSSNSPEKSYYDRKHPSRMSPDRLTNGRCGSPTKKPNEKFSSTETITYRRPPSQRTSPDKRKNSIEYKSTTNYSVTGKIDEQNTYGIRQSPPKNKSRPSIPNDGNRYTTVHEITTDLDDISSIHSHSTVTLSKTDKVRSESDSKTVKEFYIHDQKPTEKTDHSTRQPLKKDVPADRPLKRTDTYEERCRQILGITSDSSEKRRSSLEKLRRKGSSLSSQIDSLPKTSRDKPEEVQKLNEAPRHKSPTKQLQEFPAQIRRSPDNKTEKSASPSKNRKPSHERSPVKEYPSQNRVTSEKLNKQVSPSRSSPEKTPDSRQNRAPSSEASKIQEFPSQVRKSPEKYSKIDRGDQKTPDFTKSERKPSTKNSLNEYPSQRKPSPQKQDEKTSRNSPKKTVLNNEEIDITINTYTDQDIQLINQANTTKYQLKQTTQLKDDNQESEIFETHILKHSENTNKRRESPQKTTKNTQKHDQKQKLTTSVTSKKIEDFDSNINSNVETQITSKKNETELELDNCSSIEEYTGRVEKQIIEDIVETKSAKRKETNEQVTEKRDSLVNEVDDVITNYVSEDEQTVKTKIEIKGNVGNDRTTSVNKYSTSSSNSTKEFIPNQNDISRKKPTTKESPKMSTEKFINVEQTERKKEVAEATQNTVEDIEKSKTVSELVQSFTSTNSVKIEDHITESQLSCSLPKKPDKSKTFEKSEDITKKEEETASTIRKSSIQAQKGPTSQSQNKKTPREQEPIDDEHVRMEKSPKTPQKTEEKSSKPSSNSSRNVDEDVQASFTKKTVKTNISLNDDDGRSTQKQNNLSDSPNKRTSQKLDNSIVINIQETIIIDSDEEITENTETESKSTKNIIYIENDQVEENLKESEHELKEIEFATIKKKPKPHLPQAVVKTPKKQENDQSVRKTKEHKSVVTSSKTENVSKQKELQKLNQRTPGSSSLPKKPSAQTKFGRKDAVETEHISTTKKTQVQKQELDSFRPKPNNEGISNKKKPIVNTSQLRQDDTEVEEEIQTRKKVLETYEGRTPVEEPFITKKTVSLLYSDDEDEKKTTQLFIESEIIEKQPIIDRKKPNSIKSPKTTTAELIDNEKSKNTFRKPSDKTPERPAVTKKTVISNREISTKKDLNRTNSKQNTLDDIETFDNTTRNNVNLRSNRVDETVNKKKTSSLGPQKQKPFNKPLETTDRSILKKPSTKNITTVERNITKITTKNKDIKKPEQRITKSTNSQRSTISETEISKNKQIKNEKTVSRLKPTSKQVVEPEDSDEESLSDSLNESVTSSIIDLTSITQDTTQETKHSKVGRKDEQKIIQNSQTIYSEEQPKITKQTKTKKYAQTKTVISDRGTVDIQRSISSREATPDRVCPHPVTSDDEGVAPRYPDKVVEPDDGSPKKNYDKLFETTIHEDSDTIRSKKIEEVDDETERRDSRINRVDKDDESLLTVDRKINKFLSTAEKLTEKSIVDISQPAPKVDRPKFEVNDDLKEDDCLLSVSDKVQKFITEAEHLTKNKDTEHRKSVNIDVKANISNKIDHFNLQTDKDSRTSTKSYINKDYQLFNPETNNKYPEQGPNRFTTKLDQDVFITTECAEIEKESNLFRTSNQSQILVNKQQESRAPKKTPLKTSDNIESTTEKEIVSDGDTQCSDQTTSKPRKNSLKEFTPKTRRSSQEDKVILSSVSRLRSNESIKKAKAIFDSVESSTRDEKIQKDILNRPSVFEVRNKSVKELNTKKTIDRNNVTPKRLDFSSAQAQIDDEEITETKSEQSFERGVPGYMKPLNRNHQSRDRTPESETAHHPDKKHPDHEHKINEINIPGYMKPLDRSITHQHPQESSHLESSVHKKHSVHDEHQATILSRDYVPGYMKPIDRSHKHQHETSSSELVSEEQKYVSKHYDDEQHRHYVHEGETPGYMKPLDRTITHQHPQESSHLESSVHKKHSIHDEEHQKYQTTTISKDGVPGYMKPIDRSHIHQHETSSSELVSEEQKYVSKHSDDEHDKHYIYEGDTPGYMKPLDRTITHQHPQESSHLDSQVHKKHSIHDEVHQTTTVSRDDVPGYMKPIDRSHKHQHETSSSDLVSEEQKYVSKHADDKLHRHYIHEGDTPGYMQPLDRSQHYHPGTPEGQEFKHSSKHTDSDAHKHYTSIDWTHKSSEEDTMFKPRSHEGDIPGYMKPLDRSSRPQFDSRDRSKSPERRSSITSRSDVANKEDTPGYMKPLDRFARPQFDSRDRSKSPDRRSSITSRSDVANKEDTPGYMKPLDRSARPQFDSRDSSKSPDRHSKRTNYESDGDTPGYMKPLDRSARPQFDSRDRSKSPDRRSSITSRSDVANKEDTPGYMKPLDRSARPQFDSRDSSKSPDRHSKPTNYESDGDTPGYMKPLDRSARPQFDSRDRSKSPDRRSSITSRSDVANKEDTPGYMKPLDRSARPQFDSRDSSKSPDRHSKPTNYESDGDTPGYMKPLDRSSRPEFDTRERSRSPESHKTTSYPPKSDSHLPGYMKPRDQKPHRDQKERSKSPESIRKYRKPIVDDTSRPHSSTSKTSEKTTTFGVTLKRTDSGRVVTTLKTDKKHPLLMKKNITEEEIEEIYDLELLEELLLKFTIYEIRRKIRTQIKVVKKLISEGKLEITIQNLKNKTNVTNESLQLEDLRKKHQGEDSKKKNSKTKFQENVSTSPNNENDIVLKNRHEVSEYKISSSRKESVSSTYTSERLESRRSVSPEKQILNRSRKTPERTSLERKQSSKSNTETNIITEETKSYQSKYTTNGTTNNISKSNLKKTKPKSKAPSSAPQPEWVTQRNLKKIGTNEVVKKSSVTSASTSSKQTTTKSRNSEKIESTDLIASSYGIGPTDENGAPLFGLRALRAQNTNGTTKVQGTVISSEYYSETGKEPVGQISVTKYSSDPRDLGSDEYSSPNGDILSVTTTQRYGYEDTPSLKQITKTDKEICDSRTNRRKSSTKTSTLVRKNSVKALTQKFVENSDEKKKNERQTSYPKAGLILRSSSFKNESEIDGSHSRVSAEERIEKSVSVKSSKSTSGSTFLTNKSKVTGVQDAISRMKTKDAQYGDTEEDIEAKDLLNKYLGSQVIISGLEGNISKSGTASSSSSFTASAKSTSRITTVTMENGKEVKRTRTFEHPVSDEVLETVWDEQTLRYLLDQSTDYDERKRIRARLRLIMAEQEACTELVKQASQDQSSQSIDEKIETSKEVVTEGPVTTTKVTRISTQQHVSKKPMSPFAKFRQLDKQNSLNTPPSTPRTPGGSPLFKFTDAALSQSASTIKDRLLYWCRMKTKEYENIQLDNFSSSWADGLAFCALIHHFLPDAFDYHALTPKERRHNFTLAFKVADEKADIAPLLDVDDMVATMRPDWKCVFTYVQSIYRRFKDED